LLCNKSAAVMYSDSHCQVRFYFFGQIFYNLIIR
jgi:hypothetical protein